jgi:hypothetical protein
VEDGGVGWDRIQLAQDRNMLRALVSAVKKVGFYKKAGISLLDGNYFSFPRKILLHGVNK